MFTKTRPLALCPIERLIEATGFSLLSSLKGAVTKAFAAMEDVYDAPKPTLLLVIIREPNRIQQTHTKLKLSPYSKMSMTTTELPHRPKDMKDMHSPPASLSVAAPKQPDAPRPLPECEVPHLPLANPAHMSSQCYNRHTKYRRTTDGVWHVPAYRTHLTHPRKAIKATAKSSLPESVTKEDDVEASMQRPCWEPQGQHSRK